MMHHLMVLISQSIQRLDKEIIVTFAEIEQGHLGIVYQASNFFTAVYHQSLVTQE